MRRWCGWLLLLTAAWADAPERVFTETSTLTDGLSLTQPAALRLAGAPRVELRGGVKATAPVTLAGGSSERPGQLWLGGQVLFGQGLRLLPAPKFGQLLVGALPGTSFTVSGDELLVGGADVAPAANNANAHLDLTRAASATVNVKKLSIGVDRLVGSGDYHSAGTVLLPPDSTLTASEEVRISHHAAHVNWNSPGALLVLGRGTTHLTTPLIVCGSGEESVGQVRFGPRGGTLKVRADDGRTDWSVGEAGTVTSRTRWGDVDLRAGVLEAKLGTLSLARSENTVMKYSDNRAWGRFRMGAGTLDATEIVVGDFSSGIGTGPGGWFCVQGGTVNVGKGGLVITRGSSPRPHEWKLTPLIGYVLLEDAQVNFNRAGIKCSDGRDILARLIVRPGSVLELNKQGLGKLAELTLDGGLIRNPTSIATVQRIAGGAVIELDAGTDTYLLAPTQRVGSGTLELSLVKGSFVLAGAVEAEGAGSVLPKTDSWGTVLGFNLHPSGMLSPWLVQRHGAEADFVALSRRDWGGVPVPPKYQPLAASGPNVIAKVDPGATVSGDGLSVHALKNAGTVTLGDGQALTLASGGLILQGGSVRGGRLAAPKELLVECEGESALETTPAAGSLTKFGPGRLVLARPAAAELKRLTVNRGTLALAANQTAEILVHGHTTLALEHLASLDGPLTLQGAAQVRTTGDCTLRGPVTILSGRFDQPTVVRSDARCEVADGTLTLAGPIGGDRRQNASKLVKLGPGTLVLGSPGNSYLGGTEIAAGTLTAAAAALPGSVVNHGTLVLDQPGEGLLRGPLSGAGALFKRGAGAVTLLSPRGEGTQAVTVEAGRLAAWGQGLGLGPVTVAAGATLAVMPRRPGLLAEFYSHTYPLQLHRFAYADPYNFANKHNHSLLHANLATLDALLDGEPPARVVATADTSRAFEFDRDGQRFPEAFGKGAQFYDVRWTGAYLARQAGVHTFVYGGRGTDLVAVDGQTVIANAAFGSASRVGRLELTPGWHALTLSAHLLFDGLAASLGVLEPGEVQPGTLDKDLTAPPLSNDRLAFNADPELTVGRLAGAGKVDLGGGRLRVLAGDGEELRRRVADGRIVGAGPLTVRADGGGWVVGP